MECFLSVFTFHISFAIEKNKQACFVACICISMLKEATTKNHAV